MLAGEVGTSPGGLLAEPASEPILNTPPGTTGLAMPCASVRAVPASRFGDALAGSPGVGIGFAVGGGVSPGELAAPQGLEGGVGQAERSPTGRTRRGSRRPGGKRQRE